MALAEGKHMVIVFVSSMIVGKTSLTGALRRLCDETGFEITGICVGCLIRTSKDIPHGSTAMGEIIRNNW